MRILDQCNALFKEAISIAIGSIQWLLVGCRGCSKFKGPQNSPYTRCYVDIETAEGSV